jgi:hypothetical protein
VRRKISRAAKENPFRRLVVLKSTEEIGEGARPPGSFPLH